MIKYSAVNLRFHYSQKVGGRQGSGHEVKLGC